MSEIAPEPPVDMDAGPFAELDEQTTVAGIPNGIDDLAAELYPTPVTALMVAQSTRQQGVVLGAADAGARARSAITGLVDEQMADEVAGLLVESGPLTTRRG